MLKNKTHSIGSLTQKKPQRNEKTPQNMPRLSVKPPRIKSRSLEKKNSQDKN